MAGAPLGGSSYSLSSDAGTSERKSSPARWTSLRRARRGSREQRPFIRNRGDPPGLERARFILATPADVNASRRSGRVSSIEDVEDVEALLLFLRVVDVIVPLVSATPLIVGVATHPLLRIAAERISLALQGLPGPGLVLRLRLDRAENLLEFAPVHPDPAATRAHVQFDA